MNRRRTYIGGWEDMELVASASLSGDIRGYVVPNKTFYELGFADGDVAAVFTAYHDSEDGNFYHKAWVYYVIGSLLDRDITSSGSTGELFIRIDNSDPSTAVPCIYVNGLYGVRFELRMLIYKMKVLENIDLVMLQ